MRDVQQGSVLSSTFFLTILDRLLRKLTFAGVAMCGLHLGGAAHADEVWAITSSLNQLLSPPEFWSSKSAIYLQKLLTSEDDSIANATFRIIIASQNVYDMSLVKQYIFLDSKLKRNCTAQILSTTNCLQALKKSITSHDQQSLLEEACKHQSVNLVSKINWLWVWEATRDKGPYWTHINCSVLLLNYDKTFFWSKILSHVWFPHSREHQFFSTSHWGIYMSWTPSMFPVCWLTSFTLTLMNLSLPLSTAWSHLFSVFI